ncbi:thiol-disulfide exchange intermediate [Calycina marina]|uniref:Thiol-disulfide exchange intermediate n=1 Tax=Calycina marina TaxID=1763456 RepID=A0A9P7YX26_9HELO|nr:thiol-disulfide exchange intermediate [Calycina marina]
MIEIKSISQFNKAKSSGTLLIVDFYATWCGPCKAISPRFSQISTQHAASSPTITFAKCDVDKAKDVAAECAISSMPTFLFYKDAKQIDKVIGADVYQLETKIRYYTGEVAKASAASGKKTEKKGEEKKSEGGVQSLRGTIDLSKSKMIGSSNLSSVENIKNPPPAGYTIASVGGAHVLLHIVFTTLVTPMLIRITAYKDSLPNAPSHLQIGSNVAVREIPNPENPDGPATIDLTMESVAKAEKEQKFHIFSDEYADGKTAELVLKKSKFQGVKSLTIKVDGNLSGDEKMVTKIGEVEILGTRAE